MKYNDMVTKMKGDSVKINTSDYIEETEIVKCIKDLIAIPSYDGTLNQETKVAEYMRGFFEREEIEAELQHVREGRCNVTAILRGSGGGKSLLLTGHTDTVPPYDFEKALCPEIRNGQIYGRGTNDMKGQLATMMFAMAAIKRAGIKTGGDVVYAGVIDEELNSYGTKHLLESGIKADGAIVGEGTNFAINIGQKGLEWFEVHFIGKSAHGAAYKEGINAINMAVKFIDKVNKELVPEIFAKVHPVIGEATVNIATIKGGTQPSTVAGDCVVQFDRRFLPGEKYDGVVGDFEKLLAGLAAEDEHFNYKLIANDRDVYKDGYIHPPMEIAADHDLVKNSQDAIIKTLGKPPALCACGAWTDAGLLCDAGIPTIILGPGDLLSAHTNDEHISISDLLPAVQIYADIALEFCK